LVQRRIKNGLSSQQVHQLNDDTTNLFENRKVTLENTYKDDSGWLGSRDLVDNVVGSICRSVFLVLIYLDNVELFSLNS